MLTPLAVITSIIENLTLLCLMFYLAGDYPPLKKSSSADVTLH